MSLRVTQKITTQMMGMISMPKKNPKHRVYSRPIKPVKEMTEAEIDAFAEKMFARIMSTLPERKERDKK